MKKGLDGPLFLLYNALMYHNGSECPKMCFFGLFCVILQQIFVKDARKTHLEQNIFVLFARICENR